MMKQFFFSMVLAVLMVGCGGSETSSPSSTTSSGTNTTTLDTSNPNQFVMVTTANNVGSSATYFHVSQDIENASLNNLLNTGTNYSGTIATTCVKGAVTATTAQYACTTVHNTSAPFSIPDAVNNMTLNIGETNIVYQSEKTLSSGTKKTQIGTLVAQ